jgi:hypothetical protein
MAWAVWLAAPVVTTLLAALSAWWVGRPKRVPSTQEAMQAHREYLDALVVPARGAARAPSGAGRLAQGEARD